MSEAKKCDRCGKLYEYYQGVQLIDSGNHFTAVMLCGHGKTKLFDLCEDCMSQLINWVKQN